MTLLVTQDRDDITRYMKAQWGVPLAQRIGAPPVFLTERQLVDGQLPYEGDLLYVGHGTVDALGTPALIDRSNAAGVRRILVAIACRSAAGLGGDAVRGGVAYVGFTDDLRVVVSRVIDELIIRHFAALMTQACTPGEFEQAFKADCADIQMAYLTGPYGRTANADRISSTAQIMKLTVKVL
jgi:hypothetical protein